MSEPRSIRLGDREVRYLLKRSAKRRTIVFTVDEQGLAVHAPWNSTERRLNRVLGDAAAWILKKLEVWEAKPAREQRWEAGATIPYLGRPLVLDVESGAPAATAVLTDPGRLQVTVHGACSGTALRETVIGWYRRHAASNFADRIPAYAPALGVRLPKLVISNARTRWGSCNHRREIRLNWRLIQAPQYVIDYVVVHELAHLKEMNHSRRFWELVADAFPRHEEARAELDHRGRWYLDI
ncbi:MAG: SprT family zinc-dependent metalloprotease [Burkholderiales bacterium]